MIRLVYSESVIIQKGSLNVFCICANCNGVDNFVKLELFYATID
jgi:hypothetical protein